ncbi:hypothetical protein HG619_12445 [Pseudomonas syringae]|nr:hypothetical protein [Pseudomonas syringae]
MTAAEDISEGLYLKLVDHVSNLLKALAREVDDPALASAQAEAQSKLQIIEQALTKAIKELKDNAEHKTFTVAFYGETNAGKSTLIETLRILLKENTKRDQRQRFIALQQQSGLSEEALQALEAEIETLGHRLAETKNETVAADTRHEQRLVELQLQEEALRLRVEEQKRSAGLIQRILNLLRKLPEEIALVQLQAEGCVLPMQRDTELTKLRQQARPLSPSSVKPINAMQRRWKICSNWRHSKMAASSVMAVLTSPDKPRHMYLNHRGSISSCLMYQASKVMKLKSASRSTRR